MSPSAFRLASLRRACARLGARLGATLLFSAASLFAVAPLARGVAKSGVGGASHRSTLYLFRAGGLPTRRACGAAGPQRRSLRLYPLSGVLQRSRASRGAARPDRRDARPELQARADGGGLRRADAPSQPRAPPPRAAGGLAPRRETACVGVHSLLPPPPRAAASIFTIPPRLLSKGHADERTDHGRRA